MCREVLSDYLNDLIFTKSTAISAGETPDMRDACPKFLGLT
jgi:hypothetical protein